jgi:hypothetical protein
MEQLSPAARRIARASLVTLWCATAVTSVAGLHGRSATLLGETTLPASWHAALILAGALLDAVVGLAIWRWHRRVVYKLAAANLCLMTLVASLVLPSLWLDPLGSLTKNLPVLALLWILHRDAS